MACIIIEFPRRAIAITAPPDDPSVGAVNLCKGDPDRLFELACASLTIARGSDNIVTDPSATDYLTTAFVALSELLNITGEARA
jgi:hypothetical protein